MTIKATKKKKQIHVIGEKDPRGPDNTITVYLDEKGQLVIEVQKPYVRCYPFSHIEENDSCIKVIQNR